MRIPNPLDWLPINMRAFVARRLEEGFGVSLIALGLFSLIALVSWHRTDPSWNNSTGATIAENWAGLPGAFLSDILFQTLGLASLVLIMTPIIWGVRYFMHEPPNWMVRRVAAWLFATLFAATLLATFPMAKFWALAPRAGFGGVLGDILAGFGQAALANTAGRGFAFVLTALITAPIASWLTFFAADLTLAQVRDSIQSLRAWRQPAEEDEPEEERLSYPLRSRRRGTVEEPEPTSARARRRSNKLPRRRDVEPSRFRIGIWAITDTLTDWRDHLLHRGEYGALSDEEIAAARLGGNFGRRASGDDDLYDDDSDDNYDDEDAAEDDDDLLEAMREARHEPRLDGRSGPRV